MDDDASTRALILKLHDKLSEHSQESRDRDERRESEDRQRWERHQSEHRDHEIVHGKISEWQVDTNGSLKQGAKSMAEQRRATADLLEKTRTTWPKAAAAIFASLGMVALVVGWFYSQLGTKADKTDVSAISIKMEQFGLALKGIADKLGIQDEKGK